jgi:hypothetical protein
MTLAEFEEEVRRLAAGRAYSVSCVTTETRQSDGAGMKTLSWHAWIAGCRSGLNGDAFALLHWLYEGNSQGLELAIAPGIASVTVSDWAATTPPAKRIERGVIAPANGLESNECEHGAWPMAPQTAPPKSSDTCPHTAVSAAFFGDTESEHCLACNATRVNRGPWQQHS